jgi:hypothetical protein
VSGTPLNCNDNNLCTNDSCDPTAGCVYTNNALPCDDGNSCTTGDICRNGACSGALFANCDDGNPCTADICLPGGGCQHTNTPGSCDDGNPCTSGDTCSGGTCFGGPTTNCNDNNPCTDDACSPTQGCVHQNNNRACDDGNACTVGDVCGGGTCNAGAALDCNDANTCTTDTCNPSLGCVRTNNTLQCDDGDPATLLDRCAGGVCVPGNLGCPPVPAAGCRAPIEPAKSQVQVFRGSSPISDRLTWKWKAGPVTTKADFGNPTTAAGSFSLCLYDEIGGVPQLRLDRGIPGGTTCGAQPCWQESFTGFRYKDRLVSQAAGIQGVKFKAGAEGRAQILVSGRGSGLALPALPFSQDSRLIVQLIGPSACWETSYNAPARLNSALGFQDSGAP